MEEITNLPLSWFESETGIRINEAEMLEALNKQFPGKNIIAVHYMSKDEYVLATKVKS